MIDRFTRVIPILLVMLTATAPGSIVAFAQDSPGPAEETVSEPAEHPLVTEAKELDEDIREARGEIRALEERVDQAAGEDKKILEHQLTNRKLRGLRDVHSLSRNVLAQEAAGLDASEFRKIANADMVRLPKAIRLHLEAALAALADLRAARSEIAPEQLLGYEEQINKESAWLDSVHQLLYEQVVEMEAFGMDAESNRAYLVERLGQRSATLASRIELTLEEKKAIESRAKGAAADAPVQLELAAVNERLSGSRTNLNAAVKLMRDLGMETLKYRALLVETGTGVSTDILDAQVVMSLGRKWFIGAKSWALENGAVALFRTLSFLIILWVFRLLSRLARRLVERALTASKVEISQLLHETLVRTTGYVVFGLGIFVALTQAGVSLGPLLAGLGIAGFIIGFALQDSLANFAAGLMILVYRPFDVDDLVEVGGAFGKVHTMSLVTTTILTIDNQALILPNAKIWGDVIKNVTARRVRRVDLQFGIGYRDDVAKAERTLMSILEDHDKVLGTPEPVVRLHRLGESSVDFVVRPWVKTDDYWEVYWDVTREVKMRFDREGISIPFPQRDVHLYPETSSGGGGDQD